MASISFHVLCLVIFCRMLPKSGQQDFRALVPTDLAGHQQASGSKQ
jgi:hypothetical protein